MERAFRTCRAAVVTLAALIVAVAAGCSDAAPVPARAHRADAGRSISDRSTAVGTMFL